jgi:hypothetical protein
LQDDFALSLIDVPSSTSIFSKKDFYEVNSFEAYWILLIKLAGGDENPELIHMGFSSDSRYFLAGYSRESLTYDLHAKRPASLPGAIQSAIHGSFAFVGSDYFLGVDPFNPAKSPLLRFPSGERVEQLPLNATIRLKPAARGDYVIAGPVSKDHPIGIFDLKSKTVVAAIKEPAIDVYDDTVVREKLSGELSLYSLSEKKYVADVKLPQAHLKKLRAAAISPDFPWMALSNGTRGAVWDLVNNTRLMHVRSFHGAWFDNGSFYVDFPKFQEMERAIGRLSTADSSGSPGYQIGDVEATQWGRYLLVYLHDKTSAFHTTSDSEVEVRDVITGATVWHRRFKHELPWISISDGQTLLLWWPLMTSGGREEVQRFPELNKKAEKQDYLCEIVDFKKDGPIGQVLVRNEQRIIRNREPR